MAKFFMIPFGASASKSTIPDNNSDNVSWNTGYPINYEYNPLTNKDAKHIEREIFNTLLYEITAAIRELQLNGVSLYHEEIIRTTGPGYSEGSLVSYGGTIWRSKINNNRIIPNANSINNWEIVYGYDSLIKKLISDKYISEDPDSVDGYSKKDVDSKLDTLLSDINGKLKNYLHKIKGEIYLVTWLDNDRNSEGLFMCNGDILPFTTNGTSSVEDRSYYGNQLYKLCYKKVTSNGEQTTVETEFKKRWNIKINEEDKTINLPDILGSIDTDDNYISDTGLLNLGLSKVSKLPDFTSYDYVMSNSSEDNSDRLKVYRFNLLPAIYLGVPESEDDKS